MTAPAREAFGVLEKSEQEGRRWYGGSTLFGAELWVAARRAAETLTREEAEALAVRYRRLHPLRCYEVRELVVVVPGGAP